MRPVDVEVVRIGRGHHGHVGMQPQERTVELVGLDRQPRSVAQHEVAAEILRNAPEEGRTAARQRTVEPRHERRSGRLAVRPGHRHHVFPFGEVSEHLRPLLDGKAPVAEVAELAQVVGHGRRIDHHRGRRIAERTGNPPHVVFIVDRRPFGLQFSGQQGTACGRSPPPVCPRGGNSGPGRSCRFPDPEKIDIVELHNFALSFAFVFFAAAAQAYRPGSAAVRPSPARSRPRSAPRRRDGPAPPDGGSSPPAPPGRRAAQRPRHGPRPALRIGNHHGRPPALQRPGVLRLVVLRHVGRGTKTTGFATRQKLRDGPRAAARNHQIGRRIGVIHALDEGSLPDVRRGCAARKACISRS